MTKSETARVLTSKLRCMIQSLIIEWWAECLMPKKLCVTGPGKKELLCCSKHSSKNVLVSESQKSLSRRRRDNWQKWLANAHEKKTSYLYETIPQSFAFLNILSIHNSDSYWRQRSIPPRNVFKPLLRMNSWGQTLKQLVQGNRARELLRALGFLSSGHGLNQLKATHMLSTLSTHTH